MFISLSSFGQTFSFKVDSLWRTYGDYKNPTSFPEYSIRTNSDRQGNMGGLVFCKGPSEEIIYTVLGAKEADSAKYPYLSKRYYGWQNKEEFMKSPPRYSIYDVVTTKLRIFIIFDANFPNRFLFYFLSPKN